MRIAIVGAGGVGGYFGARLAAAGADVRLVARGAHLAAIRERGLRVHSVRGDVHADVGATEDASRIGASDVVLFCVKSFDTDEAAARHLPHLVGDDTFVVSLQNGIDNEERIAAVVGHSRVVGGLALIFSAISEPGVIAHSGGPARLVFGEFDGVMTERVGRLRAWCTKAAVEAEVSGDIRAALWHKYAFICAQAGTTAAIRLALGEIRDTPESWGLFRRLLEEAYAVARATGVAIPATAVDERLTFAEGLEPGTFSSLHHDLVGGKRMELEALHGTLVRLAHQHGVGAPASETVYALLKPWAVRNERAPTPSA
ncbi:MAG: 2-dehydropantoate 2-reductase [Nitriliruptorales bacterium]|nr:2-dehydropantoate 2-reductase [Nitriliruptorales bacterium]